MRAVLDRLYDAAAYVAASFLVGTLAMVLVGIVGRLVNWYVPGTDAYAGYCMAASGFLALAHTLKRREHIRVEYSVSWLLASAAMLLLSRSRPVLDYITYRFHIPDTPLTLFLIAGTVFLVMFFRFSIIISHLRDDNIALAQRLAILEYQLHSLRSHEN